MHKLKNYRNNTSLKILNSIILIIVSLTLIFGMLTKNVYADATGEEWKKYRESLAALPADEDATIMSEFKEKKISQKVYRSTDADGNDYFIFYYLDSNGQLANSGLLFIDNNNKIVYGPGSQYGKVYTPPSKSDVFKGNSEYPTVDIQSSIDVINKAVEAGATGSDNAPTHANEKVNKNVNGVDDLHQTEINQIKEVTEVNNETVDTSDPSGWEILLDGIVGVLLSPAKWLLLVIGKVIDWVLKLFTVGEGKNMSVDDIIFNKLPLTSIDFFNFNSKEQAVNTIRQNIATWYVSIRNLAAVILVLMLIYVGIRMLISTVADSKAKYKTMLVDWLVSICLLFVLHFIMIMTINLNNMIVALLDGARSSSNGLNDAAQTFFSDSLWTVSFTIGMGDAIAFVLLEALTFAFLITYIKRMITIGFLIIIAPLITITYSVDKMGDGKSQALNNWLKEFVYNILIQPFHCVTYLALVSTAVDLGDNRASLKSATLAICLLFFMAKGAEEIVRHIFHFEESKSMPNTAANAVIGYSIAKSAIDIGKKVSDTSKKNKEEKEKDKDKKEERGTGANTQQTRTAQNNTNNSQQNQQNQQGQQGQQRQQRQQNQQGQQQNPQPAPQPAPQPIPQQDPQPDSQPDQQQNTRTKKSKKRRMANRVIRGVAMANKAALGFGLGIALGGATGEANTLLGATALLGGMGIASGSKDAKKMKTEMYKKETAREFNNVKDSNGMTDEEVRKMGEQMMTGEYEPTTKAEKEYKKSIDELVDNYKLNGEDEEDAIKKAKKDLKKMEEGEISEGYSPKEYFGHIKNKLKKRFTEEVEDDQNNTNNTNQP